MEKLFLTMLNMSITGSYVILAVLLVRLLLSKAPKKYSYLLWSVVGFRLCCPVSFQSIFSLFQLGIFNMSRAQANTPAVLEYVPENIGMMTQPQMTVGISVVNSLLSESLPAATPQYSVNPMQVWIIVGTIIWCLGIGLMSAYGVFLYIKLHKGLEKSVLLEGNVYQSDRIGAPFVLGLVHPRIFIPFGLEMDVQKHVLSHERYHIHRMDHVVKLFAYVLLVLHWFNPLCWLAFMLMSKDMEMSCDEKVLEGEENIRRTYSMALLSFASNHRFPSPTPLAFGESSVKERIKNVLKWKKPAVWISVCALILCLGAVILCAANPASKDKVVTPFAAAYGVDETIYNALPETSVVSAQSLAEYCLTADQQLIIRSDNVSWSELTNMNLGDLSEFTLSKECFDEYFSKEGWQKSGLSSRKMRRENLKAWKITSEEQLYYVLQQKDGTVYLAWGWYDAEEVADPYSDDSQILQMFCLKPVGVMEKVSLTELPDDYSAVDAMVDGCVVFEDGTITAGQDIWDTFVETCSKGTPASVRTAVYYYKTDNVHFVHDLSYDGDSYTMVWYEEGERLVRNFKYLVRYEGDAPSPNATFTNYVYYVLVNDNTVTWEELEWGILSSQMGDYIPHMSVYWYREYKE
ncbi:MAG: hypothetical protein IJ327_00800 [Lachnospiraceae bacterium]|nr:hypothetical protein [Lachnospiraceae bacterium]